MKFGKIPLLLPLMRWSQDTAKNPALLNLNQLPDYKANGWTII